MFGSSSRPYSAITVHIEHLSSGPYEENDLSGIVVLIEMIQEQATGPYEASRAIRKKLKHGNLHQQLRALTLLDGLIQNAGPRFQKTFADEELMEQLRVTAINRSSDAKVKAKCKVLFNQWGATYKDTPGMERIAILHGTIPKVKSPPPQPETAGQGDYQSRRPSLAAGSAGTSSTGPSKSASVSNPKGKDKPPSDPLSKKEMTHLSETLAQSAVASPDLLNALKLVNNDESRVSENPEIVERAKKCRALRRAILKYIQQVESEPWLGRLIHANEELVNALTAYEILDKSVDVDSDSEIEAAVAAAGGGGGRSASAKPQDVASSFARTRVVSGTSPPPRPQRSVHTSAGVAGKGKEKAEESGGSGLEEDDDPFADSNAVGTPPNERSMMGW